RPRHRSRRGWSRRPRWSPAAACQYLPPSGEPPRAAAGDQFPSPGGPLSPVLTGPWSRRRADRPPEADRYDLREDLGRDQTTGGSEARLSRLLWEQEIGGSNPPRPTIECRPVRTARRAAARARAAAPSSSRSLQERLRRMSARS